MKHSEGSDWSGMRNNTFDFDGYQQHNFLRVTEVGCVKMKLVFQT